MSLVAALVAAPAALLGTAAQAQQSLTLNGKFGFLGEFEFSSHVAAQAADKKEYAGEATIKHVGVCTHAGPDQVEGQIKLRFAGWLSQISGTLVYEGQTCTYRARLSKTHAGELVCPDATVPFYVWSE